MTALSDIIGKEFPVLDKGFVRLVEVMGGDDAIVQAARISYGIGTKKVSEDRGLIRYLMRHRHTTPFEMAEIKLHVRVPMDCWRQWIRHRTASVNEYSTRYSEAIDDKQQTAPDAWRSQSKANKQGSSDFLSGEIKEGGHLSRRESELHQMAKDVYHERIDMGVAREQARKDLPLSTYTEAYWKVDLHNLFGFLSLRMDGHAQSEIQQFANTIGNEIVIHWVPHAWEAFKDYRLGAMFLTRLDIEMLQGLAAWHDGDGEWQGLADSFGWLNRKDDGTLKRNRERQEFEGKAARLSIEVPWI